MNRPSFEHPDASGIMRTWVPKCCKCDNTPTKLSTKTAYDINYALGYVGEEPHRFAITDYGSFYCDEHAPKWAEKI